MESKVKVKLCGQTSLAGADLSLKMGADYIGVALEVESSPRSLSLEAARPIFEEHRAHAFLLTCHMPLEKLEEAVMELDPYAVQLTGNESPEDLAALKDAIGGLVYKSIHLAPEGAGQRTPEEILAQMEAYAASGADGFVLDTASEGKFGGTGAKSDWALAAKIIAASSQPVFIAGGINPQNISEAAAIPGVYGVDLASGVESAPGVKDEAKLTALFSALRG